jgi:hypothetical protein
MVATRRACPLTFHQRLVYSFLVYRWRHGQGANLVRIGARLRIGRDWATRTALHGLVGHGLVEVRDRLNWATEPAGESVAWFARNRRADADWFRQFATYRLYPPAPGSPLTAMQNGLLMLLYSLAPRWGAPVLRSQTAAGLVVLLGVSERTARSSLQKLEQLGLVQAGVRRLTLVQPSEAQLGWWTDRVRKQPAGGTTPFVLSQALGWKVPDQNQSSRSMVQCLDGFGAEMLVAGYTPEELREYWRDVIKELKEVDCIFNFLVHFRQLYNDVQRIHAQKGRHRSGIHLLRHQTPKYLHLATEMTLEEQLNG